MPSITASAASGRPPHLLEKDIWVVWSLATLFQSAFGSHLVFKGGTALSKAYKVIRQTHPEVLTSPTTSGRWPRSWLAARRRRKSMPFR